MESNIFKACRIILGLTFLLSLPSPLATAQEMEVIAGGELEYQSHCAVCHGVDASGNGIMSRFLTGKARQPASAPADTGRQLSLLGGLSKDRRAVRDQRPRHERHADLGRSLSRSSRRRWQKAPKVRPPDAFSAWFSYLQHIQE